MKRWLGLILAFSLLVGCGSIPLFAPNKDDNSDSDRGRNNTKSSAADASEIKAFLFTGETFVKSVDQILEGIKYKTISSHESKTEEITLSDGTLQLHTSYIIGEGASVHFFMDHTTKRVVKIFFHEDVNVLYENKDEATLDTYIDIMTGVLFALEGDNTTKFIEDLELYGYPDGVSTHTTKRANYTFTGKDNIETLTILPL